jgi:hypothetical protein
MASLDHLPRDATASSPVTALAFAKIESLVSRPGRCDRLALFVPRDQRSTRAGCPSAMTSMSPGSTFGPEASS